MNMIRSFVAISKVIIVFFIRLHIVRIREIRNVKNTTKKENCLSCCRAVLTFR